MLERHLLNLISEWLELGIYWYRDVTGLSDKARKRKRCHSLGPPNWKDDRKQDLFLRFNSINTLLWLRQVPAVLCPFSLPYKVRARNRHTEHETLTDFTDHVSSLTIFSFHFPVLLISHEPSYWPCLLHIVWRCTLNAHEWEWRCSDKAQRPSVCNGHSSFRHYLKLL